MIAKADGAERMRRALDIDDIQSYLDLDVAFVRHTTPGVGHEDAGRFGPARQDPGLGRARELEQ